jgi:hypothetical protein
MEILKRFKYPIILCSLISILILAFYNLNIFENIIAAIADFNTYFFTLAGISCFVAAFSFAIPYYKFRKGSSKEFLKDVLFYVYIDSCGDDSDGFIPEFTKLDHVGVKTIKLSDLTAALIIATISLLFIGSDFVSFFMIPVLLGVTLLLILSRLQSMKPSMKSIPYNILRYILELPRTYFTFLSVGLILDPFAVLCFMTTASALYFVPKFRGAGGFLELYLVLFAIFIGQGPLFGLFTAFIFRINAILFFSAPVYLFKRFSK